MKVAQRIVLLLIAFPFSAGLSVAVYMALEGPAGLAALIALGVFVISESLLGYGASRIPSWSGRNAMIGQEVEVLSDFVPDRHGLHWGYVRLNGERWKGRADAERPPAAGTKLQIVGSEGLILELTLPPER